MEKLPDVTKLSSRVIRILSQNESIFTFQGTNCYLLGTGNSRILIDTGSGLLAFQELLIKVISDFRVSKIDCVILTHHHIDHIGGLKRLARESRLIDGSLVVYAADLKSIWKESDPVLEYRQALPGQIISSEGVTLECWPTPGHTSDSLCLWLYEENALFSGDTILGEGKAPVIDNLQDYLDSLSLLKNKLSCSSQPIRIYPGHAQFIEDGVDSIKKLIQRRLSRNADILSALHEKSMTPAEVASIVYDKVPAELRVAVLGTVKRHLEYLSQKNHIEMHEGKYRMIDLTQEKEL